MPSLGICSRRKTYGNFADSSQASAQPTTPPPMITTLAVSLPIAHLALLQAQQEYTGPPPAVTHAGSAGLLPASGEARNFNRDCGVACRSCPVYIARRL